ncbi:MAG: HEAT repeat domain-containing protein [Firmicutes bacterium]|nr:HEAT repeat domain-containing protein [Bacillota bacterium]
MGEVSLNTEDVGSIGEAAWIQMIRHPDDMMRFRALVMLLWDDEFEFVENLRTSREVAEQVVALLDDPSPKVRGMAILALGRVRAIASIPKLTAILRHPDETTPSKVMAVAALANQRHPDTVRVLRYLANSPKAPLEVRESSLRALGELGDTVWLRKQMRCFRAATHWELRWALAQALMYAGMEEYRDLLRELQNDPEIPKDLRSLARRHLQAKG